MALVKKQANNTRVIVIAVVVLAIGGLGFFLFQQFVSPPPADIGPGASQNRTIITEFGEEILQDDRYQELQPFGRTIQVDAETEAGNPNPFQ